MNLLFSLTANGRTFSENLKEAGTVTLLGMVAIFAVLALLWGVIEILHYAMNRTKKPKAKPAEQTVAPMQSAAPAEPEAAPAAEDNGALIAVITAAISAAMAAEGNLNGFRVVSFKRVQPAKRRRF